MPSQLHEGLVGLFRDQPALAPELLAQALHADVPEYSEARIDSAELTALAHGQDPDVEKAVEIALAAQGATEDLDTDQSRMYFDLITCCLSEAARRVLETMDPKKYQYQSEFARRYYGQGKEEGMAKGLVEGRAEMALTILSKRFGSLPEVIQSKIRCANVAELNALADRLLSAHSLNEALGALG